MRFYEGPIEPEAIVDAIDARRFLFSFIYVGQSIVFLCFRS